MCCVTLVETEGNQRLTLYVAAEKKIAAEKICQLVDLYGMFLRALNQKPAGRKTWLTGDGGHMNPLGDAAMAVGVLRPLGVPDAKIAATDSSR
jgi:lysophospholipase L1-like esterase